MQSTSGPSKQWMEGDVVVMKPYKNAADNGRVPERDLDSLGKHAMDGYTFFQEGVIALNNVADAETFARLEKEGTLLLNSNKTGNILFDGDAPAAYRHQVKLRPTKDSSRAAEIIKFSTGLLQQLQQSLPDLVTKHHKVEYMALIANVQGKSTCAQLLHCDRALRGGGPDDMRAYCFVAHVPLTKEGQTLSVLLGSHAYERHNYSATTARLHHVKTGLTGALLHVGHLIHAGFSSKEGLQNMRLVINYSAQEPPKGVDSVLPHFINGEQRALAEAVSEEAANAWSQHDLELGTSATIAKRASSKTYGKKKKAKKVISHTADSNSNDHNGSSASTAGAAAAAAIGSHEASASLGGKHGASATAGRSIDDDDDDDDDDSERSDNDDDDDSDDAGDNVDDDASDDYSDSDRDDTDGDAVGTSGNAAKNASVHPASKLLRFLRPSRCTLDELVARCKTLFTSSATQNSFAGDMAAAKKAARKPSAGLSFMAACRLQSAQKRIAIAYFLDCCVGNMKSNKARRVLLKRYKIEMGYKELRLRRNYLHVVRQHPVLALASWAEVAHAKSWLCPDGSIVSNKALTRGKACPDVATVKNILSKINETTDWGKLAFYADDSSQH